VGYRSNHWQPGRGSCLVNRLSGDRSTSLRPHDAAADLSTKDHANCEPIRGVSFGTFSAMFFFASLFMQQVYQYSPMKAGFAYVPLAAAVVVGAGLASSLITKIAARPILITGLASTVTGLLLLWRAPVGGSYLTDLLPPFLLLGLGCAMCFVTPKPPPITARF
jgi:hypothetical protein